MKLSDYTGKKVQIEQSSLRNSRALVSGILRRHGVFYYIKNKNSYVEFYEGGFYQIIPDNEDIIIKI